MQTTDQKRNPSGSTTPFVKHQIMGKQISPKRGESSMLLSSLLGVWLVIALSTQSVDVDTCVHATTNSGRKIMLVKKGKKKRVHRIPPTLKAKQHLRTANAL
jgi:hypothetical protein